MGKKFIAKHYFFLANNFTFPAENFIFHADPKILRYYLTWKHKSLAKSAGNVFPAECTQKSAGKAKSSSNGLACYKESWS